MIDEIKNLRQKLDEINTSKAILLNKIQETKQEAATAVAKISSLGITDVASAEAKKLALIRESDKLIEMVRIELNELERLSNE